MLAWYFSRPAISALIEQRTSLSRLTDVVMRRISVFCCLLCGSAGARRDNSVRYVAGRELHQRGAEAHGETLTLHEPLAMASVSPTPRAWRENATDTPEKKIDGFDKNATPKPWTMPGPRAEARARLLQSESILQRVFQFCDVADVFFSAVRVCRRWRDVALTPESWEEGVRVPASLRDSFSGTHVAYYCRLWREALAFDFLECRRLDDTALVFLAHTARRARELRVSGCRALTDDSLARVAHVWRRRLRTFEVARIPGVTDCTLRALGCGVGPMTALRRINLSGCDGVSNSGIAALVKGAPALDTIWLDECECVTDETLGIIARGCTSLRMLSVAATRVTLGGARCLSGIAALNMLNLAQCRLVGPIPEKKAGQVEREGSGVAAGAAGENVDRKQLLLNKGEDGDGHKATAMGGGALSVRSVDLSYTGIGDESVRWLCEHLLKAACVTRVSLAGCEACSDGALVCVLRRLPNLTHLDVSRCRKMSDAGVRALGTGRRLRLLRTLGCYKITRAGISSLGLAVRVEGEF